MRSRPNAAELLEIAEQVLASEVAPDMSKRQRYNVALITSAMGIARRELAGGLCAWPDELNALKALYGAEHREADEEVVRRLNRRFAADLRAGVYDEKGKSRKSALELMREDVLARLAEDNPRYEK
jgi:hypothetical protein